MAEHIKIGDISPRIQYAASGTQTVFIYPFPIFQDSDLSVYLDGVQQVAGFSVAGAGQSAGGTITFNTPPGVDSVVMLVRNLVIARTSDFQESGEFRAKVINDELDYLVAVAQQISEQLSRALRLADSDGATTIAALPDKDSRKGKVMGFHATTGEPVVSTQNMVELEGARGYADAASAAAGSAEVAKIAAEAARDDLQLAGSVVIERFVIDEDYTGGVTQTLSLSVAPDGNANVSVHYDGAKQHNATFTVSGAVIGFDAPIPENVAAVEVRTVTPFPALSPSAQSVGVAALQTDAKGIDIPFLAGFNQFYSATDIAVRKYSAPLVMPRACKIIGAVAALQVAPAGAGLIVDITKNGTSIYATRPGFADGATALTAGVLESRQIMVNAADRLEFEVTQVGSPTPGQGLSFTLKMELA